MKRFNGRCAIVTGGGSGIGAAICRELAEGGAKVVVADMNAEHARAIADQIGGAPFACDVSDPTAVEEMVEFARKSCGGLHYLVNNAGIGGPQAVTGEYPVEDWHKVIDVNLHGVFYGLRYGLPAIEASGGGAVVNMSSILGSVGFQLSSAYVAAKHALVGLTKTVGMEYARRGVRVNAVGPAFIDTPLLAGIPQEMYDGLTALHPAGRLGKPEEVSALTCFLLSDAASFITGSYHLVDGGYTAQ